jgi:TolB-like protein
VTRILEELKRRNVTRVAMLYVVSSWLLLQVFDVLISIAQLPDWVGTTVLTILLTGFPISLLIAWFFELTPQGLKRETDDTIHNPAVARRVDFIIIGVLAAAVLVLVFDNYVLSKPGVPQQSVGKLDPRSIAVLPFSNSSAAAENADFFADGVHDDLLTQLAKLSGLKVISRTSVMEYRDTPKNMRQIGQELGAGSLLEGSVQRAGNSLRINAQLIDAIFTYRNAGLKEPAITVC